VDYSQKNIKKKLVYFEAGDDIAIAISREKQIKGGSRKKKFELINSINPDWEDLFGRYFGESYPK
jgi:putative endonuclease